MTVEIGAKPGDLPVRPGLGIGCQESQVGPRRTDHVDMGELAAEPLGDRRERKVERGIAGDPIGLGDPVDAPHNEKRLAEDGRIRACEERLGNGDPRCENRLLHGEFLEGRQARRNPRRGGGA